jgi:hypothetical protein
LESIPGFLKLKNSGSDVFYMAPLLTTSVNLSLHMTGEEAETFSPGSPQGTIFSITHAQD